MEVLELKEKSIVADIGAGDGNQTIAIARYIGPEGKIYSTELGQGRVKSLNKAVANSGYNNIEVLEGHPNRTNLPEKCCDAIFMRRVYHHITNPTSFNASLFASLKHGGRLAIIDFEPKGSEAELEDRDAGNQYGVRTETVVKELKKSRI